jgi:hypothetical protein
MVYYPAMNRRTFITGLGAAVTLAPGISLRSAPAAGTNPDLTKINPKYLVTPQEVTAWHAAKDSKGGPTMSGSPSWKNYLQLMEKELRAAGVVDISHNAWSFTRWYTTEWPDDSNWSLHVDNKKIKVASYGCNSGKTPDAGVTGELAVYQTGMPAEQLRGKIAIIVKEPANEATVAGDHEFLTNPETFPDPAAPQHPRGHAITPFPIMGLGAAQPVLTAAGAIGAIIAMPLSYDALSGTYTFGVPKLHDIPTLYVDQDTGKSLVAAAAEKKSARLRLISQTEEAETYQLFGYLPGKDYGTADDKQVLLITHTDGPSISQENGPLGILSIIKYFSHIPKADRPRSLMVFLDCRHYMPGAEREFAAQDYGAKHPEIYKPVIAAMGIEHLGQICVEELDGQPYHRTNLPEVSTVWTTNNQKLVDLAEKAIKDNKLQRVQVQVPGRPGVHGGTQGPWYGLGGIARRLGIPGASTMGSMGAYWSTKARMDYLDPQHFVTQIATMSQICGELMVAVERSL